jgi:hypothetical protein
MKFTLKQDTRNFDDDLGNSYVVRTLQPSEPYGAWAGTPIVIREWKICPPGEMVYRDLSTEELLDAEISLGEWKRFYLTRHCALGLVTTPVS